MSKVKVTVDGDGKVRCDPAVLQVSGRTPAIQYLLATEGFYFPAERAVVVTKPSVDFPEPGQTISPTHVTLDDRNKTRGLHAYTVTVVESASGRRISHDPEIRNDGNG